MAGLHDSSDRQLEKAVRPEHFISVRLIDY
jgi:hypothetical protein